MDENKVLEKVRRLFELAKSSNEFESAAAAAKAQELLHKYNLERGDVPVSEKLPYKRELIRLKGERWRAVLMNVLAKANGAYLISLDNKYVEHALIGQQHVIEVTEYSYQQMEKRIGWLADTAWDIYEGGDNERTYKEAFKLGIISALSAKLRRQVEEQKNESVMSTSLVVKADAELKGAVSQWYPRLIAGQSRPLVRSEGYGDGQMSGKHLSVNPGLTGARGVRRLS